MGAASWLSVARSSPSPMVESQPEKRQLRRHWANLRGERRPRVVLRCVGAHVSESSLAAVCMYVPVFVDPGGLRLIH